MVDDTRVLERMSRTHNANHCGIPMSHLMAYLYTLLQPIQALTHTPIARLAMSFFVDQEHLGALLHDSLSLLSPIKDLCAFLCDHNVAYKPTISEAITRLFVSHSDSTPHVTPIPSSTPRPLRPPASVTARSPTWIYRPCQVITGGLSVVDPMVPAWTLDRLHTWHQTTTQRYTQPIISMRIESNVAVLWKSVEHLCATHASDYHAEVLKRIYVVPTHDGGSLLMATHSAYQTLLAFQLNVDNTARIRNVYPHLDTDPFTAYSTTTSDKQHWAPHYVRLLKHWYQRSGDVAMDRIRQRVVLCIIDQWYNKKVLSRIPHIMPVDDPLFDYYAFVFDMLHCAWPTPGELEVACQHSFTFPSATTLTPAPSPAPPTTDDEEDPTCDLLGVMRTLLYTRSPHDIRVKLVLWLFKHFVQNPDHLPRVTRLQTGMPSMVKTICTLERNITTAHCNAIDNGADPWMHCSTLSDHYHTTTSTTRKEDHATYALQCRIGTFVGSWSQWKDAHTVDNYKDTQLFVTLTLFIRDLDVLPSEARRILHGFRISASSPAPHATTTPSSEPTYTHCRRKIGRTGDWDFWQKPQVALTDRSVVRNEIDHFLVQDTIDGDTTPDYPVLPRYYERRHESDHAGSVSTGIHLLYMIERAFHLGHSPKAPLRSTAPLLYANVPIITPVEVWYPFACALTSSPLCYDTQSLLVLHPQSDILAPPPISPYHLLTTTPLSEWTMVVQFILPLLYTYYVLAHERVDTPRITPTRSLKRPLSLVDAPSPFPTAKRIHI